jgi:hypothetical protein
MPLDPSAVESLQALLLGFAFAGLLASGFEVVTAHRANFRLLQTGGMLALASVPVLVFCGPVVILRNTASAHKLERRSFHILTLATVVACVWSLMSGRLVLDVAQALAAV